MINDAILPLLISNILLIVAAITIVTYGRRIKFNYELKRKSEEHRKTYNNLFEVLLESTSLPTVIVNEQGQIQSYNDSFITELDISDTKDLPVELSFISDFMRSTSIHKESEEKINDAYYIVTLSKFKSQLMSGALINFTDITSIKESQELQTTFLQNASHELKTPIAAIQGICELLIDGRVKEEEKKIDFLKVIAKENLRLKNIIDDLTTNRQHLPIYTQFYFSELFNDLSLFYENFHDLEKSKKDIVLITDNQVEQPFTQDAQLVRQICINLIENAYKYTDKGSITITAYNDGDQVKISIKDTGIGIDYQHIKNIFNRFYRVDVSRARDTGGTGLGLSIVKEIVESIEGSIEVTSKVGQGTEFIISLNNMAKKYK